MKIHKIIGVLFALIVAFTVFSFVPKLADVEAATCPSSGTFSSGYSCTKFVNTDYHFGGQCQGSSCTTRVNWPDGGTSGGGGPAGNYWCASWSPGSTVGNATWRVESGTTTMENGTGRTCVGPPPPPPAPDLVVRNLALNQSNPSSGQSINFSAQGYNRGNATARSGAVGRFYLDIGDNSGNNVNNWELRLGDTTFGSFSAGQISGVRNSNNWTAQAGRHRIAFCIDITNVVNNESNEGNNCSAIRFNVAAVESGSLSCTSATPSSITLSYSFSGATNVNLYRNGSLIVNRTSSPGTYTNTGLPPSTSYTYTMRSGNTNTLLATATSGCATQAAPTNTLNVRSVPTGITITNSPCNPTNCTYQSASTITRALTAPSTFTGGYNFSSWSGCDSASGTTCNVSVSSGATKTVTANYVSAPRTLRLEASANGQPPNPGAFMNASDNSFDCTTDITTGRCPDETRASNFTVQVEAPPSVTRSGVTYWFQNWIVAVSGGPTPASYCGPTHSANPCTFGPITQGQLWTVRAYYVPTDYTLTIKKVATNPPPGRPIVSGSPAPGTKNTPFVGIYTAEPSYPGTDGKTYVFNNWSCEQGCSYADLNDTARTASVNQPNSSSDITTVIVANYRLNLYRFQIEATDLEGNPVGTGPEGITAQLFNGTLGSVNTGNGGCDPSFWHKYSDSSRSDPINTRRCAGVNRPDPITTPIKLIAPAIFENSIAVYEFHHWEFGPKWCFNDEGKDPDNHCSDPAQPDTVMGYGNQSKRQGPGWFNYSKWLLTNAAGSNEYHYAWNGDPNAAEGVNNPSCFFSVSFACTTIDQRLLLIKYERLESARDADDGGIQRNPTVRAVYKVIRFKISETP